ncbi:TraB domain-containing protein [Pyrococcus abyssi]|nr:TraB/GumN family protein [Pyrococcus abyssi]
MSYLRYVKIVGTVHVSSESVNEVRRIILEEDPDAIALELDYERLLSLLSGSNLTFSQAMKLGKMGILAYILQEVEIILGKELGTPPGSEMIEAFEVAKTLGIPVYMIDQPIRVTLRKLLSIPLGEKIRAMLDIISTFINPGAQTQLSFEDVEGLSFEFRRKYPTMYKILVEERNLYMARNIMRIVDILLERKKKVKVVAVVGLGHKKGIEKILSRSFPKGVH